MLFQGFALAAFAIHFVGVDGPKDLSADFTVPEGLAVTLWAESPLFFNPTALDVDAQGRIWVTEAVNYRKWNGRNPGLGHPDGDRVIVLEDTDGDGAADKSTVFAEDKDLVAPLGICVLDEYTALVSCSPNAFIYTDTDHDGKADKRETFLTGFGGHDHDHGLHSFVIGPDGKYYVAVGNAGPHIVTDRDGFTLRSGSLYNDGGEHPADNKPGLVSDDGRVWTGGLILRFDADGGGLSVRAHNFRNEYEVAVDAFGDMYTADNDDDGNQSCRALGVLPRSNNGYFSADGARYWTADRRPGQETQRAHWHQDDPGVAPMGVILGAGGPTGVAVIENADLGPMHEGMVLAADAGASTVYRLVPLGRLGLYNQQPIARSREREGDGGKSHWFRPSDVLIGTDGAAYVSDWYDPGVGGHAMGDREGYGRILRIARKGAGTRPVAVDLSNTPGRIAALASPAVNVRGRAARALLADPAAKEALTAFFHSPSAKDERTRARAQWIMAGLGAARPPAASNMLTSSTSCVELRASPASLRTLTEAAVSLDPYLRREVALTIEDDLSSDADDVWIMLSRSFDGRDRMELESLGIAARGRESRLFARLVEGVPDPLTWNARLAGLAWRLHPVEAVTAHKARAMAAALSKAEREQAVDALAFTADRSAGEALLDVALAGPADVQPLARWWIRFRDGNDWRAWRLATQLGGSERADAKLVFESPVMKQGLAAIDVDLRGATQLFLCVDDAGNGNGCDWADWVAGKLIGPDGETALADLPWKQATAAWGQVQKNKNCNGGPLVIAGKPYEHGIGTHANSEIAYELPAGKFERLQVAVGPDEQGVKQNGGTSIRFRVFVTVPPDPQRFERVDARLLDPKLSAAERKSAADELCSTREGGLHALAASSAKRYDEGACALIAVAIFKCPDLAVRALASEQFSRASGERLSIAALEKLSGDEKRGEKLFFSDTAACSKCHVFAGRGGDIGPDLSGVHTKYAPSALFDAILNPSAGIAFGYDTWMFETEDERVVSGFLLADGEQVIVKDTAGVRTVLSKSEIVSRRKAAVSAMPDNVSASLSAQDLADVVAFLTLDRTKPRKLGAPIPLFDGVDLAGWTFYLDAPGAKMSDVWSVADGVLDCKGQPIGYLRTEAQYEDFVLELDWRFPAGGEPGNSGVLLRRVGPDKVWPKSVEAQLQHRSAGDIWNIDDVPMLVDPARTSGRHTEKSSVCNERPIGEWNHYKITLDRGDLTLEVNGTVQNRATWVERVAGNICLQSEGSRIQFRDILLRKIE